MRHPARQSDHQPPIATHGQAPQLTLQGIPVGRATPCPDRLHTEAGTPDASGTAGPDKAETRMVEEQSKWCLHHLN
jgi:hypothetical protein